MALKPVSVKQLNGYIKRVLQSDPILGNVSVVGEISNFKLHGSGHVYFNLKDDSSKINCFLPSGLFQNLRFELDEGMQVIATGYINIYERGGSYSLNIREINIEGVGNLAIAFENLKKKLEAEGLFDQANKKPIPTFPEKIAVITSETGAAVQDILKIIKNKNDYTNVLVYPSLVQGERAAGEIADGIETVNRLYPDIDTIIVGRGGGSVEELWPFNEEIVARAIYNSNIPVISAVGHQTDVTIADFVADKRAETPTAAADMAVPDTNELKFYVDDLGQTLVGNLNSKVEKLELRLFDNRMDAMKNQLIHRIEQSNSDIFLMMSNMTSNIKEIITSKEHSYEKYLKELEALNPKSIMERGYSVLSDGGGKLISSVKQLNVGDSAKVTLMDGSADITVDELGEGIDNPGTC